MPDDVRKSIDNINMKIKKLDSLYRTAALRSGVADGEVCIWSALFHNDKEYSQHDLCMLLSLPRQTVNSLVSGMRRRGYVDLEHMPGTRNRKVIRLTPSGQAFCEDEIKWLFEAEQAAMESASPEEIQICISMLEKYIARFRAELDHRSPKLNIRV